jgi:spore coat protein CotH
MLSREKLTAVEWAIHPRPSRRPMLFLCALLLLTGAALTAAVLSGRGAGLTLHAQEPPAPEPELFDTSVLRDWRLEPADADWLARIERGETVLADLEVEGERYTEVAVSQKGNSSARVPGLKQPLNLTLDENVAGQRLMGYDVLNLNNGFMNPTFTREVLTLRSLAEHMPMPQGAWANIALRDDTLGLYVLVEQIEGTFLRSWFGEKDGWLFKADAPGGAGGPGPGPGPRPFANAESTGPLAPAQGGGGFRSALQWQGEDLAPYQAAYDLKTSAQDDAPWLALRELIRVLDAPESAGGPSAADFPEAIRQVLDVDGALWYLAGMNLFTNYDSYYSGHNFYLYQSQSDGRFHILAWDVNEAFGLFPGAGISPADSTAVAQTDPFLMATGTQAASRPLIRRLLAVPAFRADYLAHYRTLRETVFEPAGLEARIAGYQGLIRAAAEADPNRLYPFDLFDANVREDVRADGRAVPGILKVAGLRTAWLDARADMLPPDLALAERKLVPEQPVSGLATGLSLRFEGADAPVSVEIEMRLDGGAPQRLAMTDDAVGDSWSVLIPMQDRGVTVSYFARASFADGRSAFFPASNLLHPWSFKVQGAGLPEALGGPLVINEIMADNGATLADPAGEYDDWVELYNRGDEALNLAGYHLSDNVENPLAFALPEVTLAPGGYFLIWCDNDPDQGAEHADFRLSKDGETLLLSTLTETVDRVEFGPQTTDVSWARRPDGSEDWVGCWDASPGSANVCNLHPTTTPTGAVTVTPTGEATATSTGEASATPPGASATPGDKTALPPSGPAIYLPWLYR